MPSIIYDFEEIAKRTYPVDWGQTLSPPRRAGQTAAPPTAAPSQQSLPLTRVWREVVAENKALVWAKPKILGQPMATLGDEPVRVIDYDRGTNHVTVQAIGRNAVYRVPASQLRGY